MPSWKEWNDEMTEDQRAYSSYKIMECLTDSIICIPETCKAQREACEKKFGSQKDVSINRKLVWFLLTAIILTIVKGFIV